MRPMPEAIARALGARTCTPSVRVVLETEPGPRDWKDSQGDWAAPDPAAQPSWQKIQVGNNTYWVVIPADTNIDLHRIPGAVTLAGGNPTTAAGAGAAPGAEAGGVLWKLRVRETGQTYVSNPIAGLTGGGHSHIYQWTYTHLADPQPLRIAWTPQITLHLTELRLWLANHGNVAADATIRILDAQGQQIGPAASVRVPAGQTTPTETLVSGLSVHLTKGRRYTLEIMIATPADSDFQPQTIGADIIYSIDLRVHGAAVPTLHGIPTTPDGGEVIPYGGKENFQPQGSFTRTFDVGETPPQNNGEFVLLASVPAGASITATAWCTDDPNLAALPGTQGWISYGDILANPTGLPAHRFWRIRFALASNATHDEAPAIHRAEIRYGGPQALLGTHADVSPAGLPVAVRAVSAIRSFTQQLTDRPGRATRGGVSITLEPHPAVQALPAMPLRGREARVLLGVLGVPAEMEWYRGQVSELRYRQGRYELQIDDPLDLSIRVPNTQTGGAWDAIVYDPTTNGGQDWHLADIARDLLLGRALIPQRLVDVASLELVKAMHPNRTGSRRITRPTPVAELLAELAMLLEAHWLMRAGKLALVPEPDATAAPMAVLDPSVIARGSLTWRRGWRDLKNGVLVLTGWDPQAPGTGDQQFSAAEAAVDAASVARYGLAVYETLRDKWNVPAAELQALAQNHLTRWSRGRQVVDLEASLAVAHLEPGDVVLLRSRQLPDGIGELKMMVARADVDWLGMRVKMTLLEV